MPVTGSMKMTFDKAKLLPIFKQVMAAQGGSIQMTDDQINALIDNVAGSGRTSRSTSR